MSFTNIKYKIKDLIDKIIAKIKQFMFTIKKKMMEKSYQQLSEKAEAVLKKMSTTGIIKMTVIDDMDGVTRSQFYPFVAVDPAAIQEMLTSMKESMAEDGHSPTSVMSDVSLFNAGVQSVSTVIDAILPMTQDVVSHPETYLTEVDIASAKPSVALKIMFKAQECNLKAMEIWKRGMNSLMTRVSPDDTRRLSILNNFNSRVIQFINLLTQLANTQGRQYVEGLRTVIKYGNTQQTGGAPSLESAYDVLYSDIELI